MIFEELIKQNRTEFITEVIRISSYLGVRSYELMFLMWFETGRTLDHRIVNFQKGDDPDPAVRCLKRATGLIQFMPACLSIDTEILTTSGWKTFFDVEEGDEILSYNEETDKIERDNILDLFYYNSTDCYRIHNKQFDFIATDNHRWYCDYNGKVKVKTTKELSKQSSLYKFIRAKKFTFESESNNDLFFELLGFIIGDGCIQKKGNDISLYQSIKTKPEIVERINYITNTLYGTSYHNCPNGMVKWIFTGEKARGISKYFLNNDSYSIKQKVLDKTELLNRSESELRAIKNGIMQSDGTMQYGKYEQYVQSDFERASDFQIICLLLGEMGNMKANKRKNLYQKFFNGCVSRIKPFKYHINLQKTAFTEARSIRMNYDKIKGPVEVWCPQTKNKTWIARRNGYVTITGNTAIGLGTTNPKLREMTNYGQLEYVKMHLSPFRGKYKDWLDLYCGIFWPAAVGKSDNYRITSDIVAKQNTIFDLNRDLDIEKSEIRRALLKQIPEKYKSLFA